MLQRIKHWEWFPFCVQIVITILLVALAGWVSIHESKAYFSIASFHFDSASYLFGALNYHEMAHSMGTIHTVWELLHVKDSLELILRVIFFPSSLQLIYGHMVVLLPFLTLFIFLILYSVYKRTQSWLASMSIASSLFCFPFIYNPYMGIADNWRESIAIWLLGAAVLSWLLSEMLKRPLWSILSGTLLGLLVMERTALAVYAAMLFFPIFLCAIYLRLRNDGAKNAFSKIIAFALPPCLFTGMVVLLQWKTLYTYYFVAGYAYAAPGEIAPIFLALLSEKIGFALYALPFIYLACCFLSGWKWLNKNVAIALWFVIGFPLVVVMAHTVYFGFYNTWIIFLLVLLVTLIPEDTSIWSRGFLIALLIGAIGGSIYQYNISKKAAKNLAQSNAPWRTFFDKAATIIMAQPVPRYYEVVFDEEDQLLMDHLLLHRGENINDIKVLDAMYVHDSYYFSVYKTNDIQQIIKKFILKLQKHDGTIVFAKCDARDLANSASFGFDAKKIAIPVTTSVTNYLLHNSHWEKIGTLDSPRGCVVVLKYAGIANR